jgi:cytochrome c oxidase subunit 2
MRNLPLMPEQASKFAEDLDPLYWVLVLLTVAFTGIVLALLLYFAIKYRRGSKADRSRPVNEHHLLEFTWSFIPLVLGLGVFVWGAKLFANVFGPAPPNSLEVFVIGKQWMWHLQHSNGVRENNELHIPVGRPIKLTMVSQDVIHDFFVPAFRIHMDVVPGRYTTTWFEPTKVGKWRIFCAQYCGTKHSQMTGWVYTMDPVDYAKWLANGGNTIGPAPRTMESVGQEIYEQHACGQCHDADGMQRGPSLLGLYGSQVRLKGGKTVIADDKYLRESILNPSEDVAEQYQQVMPSYKGQLTEEQVLQLIAYIKSKSGRASQSGENIPADASSSAARTSKPTKSTGP